MGVRVEREHHLCHLSSPPPPSTPLFFPSLHFPPSTPLSCCFWLLVGVRRRQTNRRACLSLPVGNSSALLTLHYLALGYLNPLIYYGEHGATIPSTGDGTSSISHHTRRSFTHTHTRTCPFSCCVHWEHKGRNAHCAARCATHTWRHEASQFVPNNHRN